MGNELPKMDVNSKPESIRQRPIVSSESEDDSEDDQVEIIDERTIARGDHEEEAIIVKLNSEPEPVPIGVIINESTEDVTNTGNGQLEKETTEEVSEIEWTEGSNDTQPAHTAQ